MRFPDFRKPEPSRFFLFTGLLTGLLLLFLTPPFQAPDEFNHFYKAWQVSEGTFTGVRHNDRVGGFVPAGVVEFGKPFQRVRFNSGSRSSFDSIRTQAAIPLQADRPVFVDFPNTALYSPVVYLPQAATIFILRQFDTPPFYIYYLARIVTLLCWILFVYFALRLLPAYQWLFVFLALLPQSLFTNCSLSADAMTNGIAFYLIAWLLHRAYVAPDFNWKHVAVLCGLAFLIASAKMVYTPLLLLVFLIPKTKAGTAGKFYLQTGAVFLAGAITLLLWTYAAGLVYTPFSAYNPAHNAGIDLIPNADMHLQLQYLGQHPAAVFEAFFLSLYKNAQSFSTSYIGNLGWLDTPLPWWFVLAAWGVIVAAISSTMKTVSFSRKQMLLVFLAALGCMFLLVFSQYLSWSEVGASRLVNMQGRYFVPIFPLLFMLFAAIPVRRLKLPVLFFVTSGLVSACFTCVVVYLRYYSSGV